MSRATAPAPSTEPEGPQNGAQAPYDPDPAVDRAIRRALAEAPPISDAVAARIARIISGRQAP